MKIVRIGSAWLADIVITPPERSGYTVVLRRESAARFRGDDDAGPAVEFLRRCGADAEAVEYGDQPTEKS